MAIIFATRTSDGAPLSFRVVRGSPWDDEVVLTDEVTGQPVDLTGVSDILMRIRRTLNASTVLMELSITNGRIEVTDAEGGTFAIAVSGQDSNDEFPNTSKKYERYVYDVLIERSADEWEPAISGKVRVDRSVSRPLDDA